MKTTATTLNIALIGYGTMGKELERLAPECGCTVQEIFTSSRSLPTLTPEQCPWDVAIDFSSASAVPNNIEALGRLKKNVVVGTTGWMERLNEVEQSVQRSGIGLVYGSNFSVGVQVFFQLIAKISEYMAHYPEYDLAIHEIHHRRKKDSPGGTALSLGSIVLEHSPEKTTILPTAAETTIQHHQLHVSSTRVGDTPGTHTVYVDSPADTIELTHRARNRSGFAMGALRAAHWIYNRQGVFDFTTIFPVLHE